MKNISRILALGWISVLMPLSVSAALVPNCDVNCGLTDFISLVNTVINYAITLALIVGGVMIMVAGFKFVMASGNDSEIKEAKKTITMVLTGLLVILAAFLIVKFVLQLAGSDFKAPAFN
jgi:heme/copper-type cytochrome/quinol oxidase subunit 2